MKENRTGIYTVFSPREKNRERKANTQSSEKSLSEQVGF